jgi:hypothetical protein
MNYIFNIMCFVFSLIVISGCSTWTADKCQSTNWDAQGFSEGSIGRPNSGGVYASKCQKKGISVNSQAYDTGYTRGLNSYCNYNKGHQAAFSGLQKEALCSANNTYNDGYAKGSQEYCTSENGYKIALDGGNEAKICSGTGFNAFMTGYKKGRKKFVIAEINNIKDDQVKAQKDLDNVRDQLADKQYQLNRIPKHSYEPGVVRLRQDLEAEIANLMQDRDSIKKEVDSMDDRLRALEKEANN